MVSSAPSAPSVSVSSVSVSSVSSVPGASTSNVFTAILSTPSTPCCSSISTPISEPDMTRGSWFTPSSLLVVTGSVAPLVSRDRPLSPLVSLDLIRPLSPLVSLDLVMLLSPLVSLDLLSPVSIDCTDVTISALTFVSLTALAES